MAFAYTSPASRADAAQRARVGVMCHCRALVRILHVTPYFADAWAYGGIPRLAHSLARGLARRGHEVTVCTTDACDDASRLAPPFSRMSDGVAVLIFPNV